MTPKSKPGGKRPGAGRPKGVRNKKTKELLTRVAAEGVMPLDVMLQNMRAAHARVVAIETRLATTAPEEIKEEAGALHLELLALREVSETCAKDAAPYLHPRLSSIEHKVSPYNLEQLSDKQLDALEQLLGFADPGRDPGGAPPPAGSSSPSRRDRIH